VLAGAVVVVEPVLAGAVTLTGLLALAVLVLVFGASGVQAETSKEAAIAAVVKAIFLIFILILIPPKLDNKFL
jgi:hypothetical protein